MSCSVRVTGTTAYKQLILRLKLVKTGSLPSLQLQSHSAADVPCWKTQGEPQAPGQLYLKNNKKKPKLPPPKPKVLPWVQLVTLHLPLNSWVRDA